MGMVIRDDLRDARAKFRKKASELEMNFEGRAKQVPLGEEWTSFDSGIELKEITVDRHEGSTIIIVHASKGSKIRKHWHAQDELIHVLSGRHRETVTGKVMEEGDFMHIPSGGLHGSRFLEDTILVVQWKPKLGKI